MLGNAFAGKSMSHLGTNILKGECLSRQTCGLSMLGMQATYQKAVGSLELEEMQNNYERDDDIPSEENFLWRWQKEIEFGNFWACFSFRTLVIFGDW